MFKGQSGFLSTFFPLFGAIMKVNDAYAKRIRRYCSLKYTYLSVNYDARKAKVRTGKLENSIVGKQAIFDFRINITSTSKRIPNQRLARSSQAEGNLDAYLFLYFKTQLKLDGSRMPLREANKRLLQPKTVRGGRVAEKSKFIEGENGTTTNARRLKDNDIGGK